jgi:hypothetical protein
MAGSGAAHLNIVILPFAQSSKVEDFEQTTRWMLANRFLSGRMLNGYSGFFPTDHGHIRDEMLKFPTSNGIQLLQQKGIDYVVVYHNLANTPQPDKMIKYLPLVYRDTANNVGIYTLRK